MTRRGRKWVFGIAVFVLAIAVGVWISYLRLLPWIVRREVNAAFASVGLGNVKFEVQHATLFGTKLTGIHDDEVGLGAVSIRYSPWDAINGELKSIRVSNARLEIDLDHPSAIGLGARADASGGAKAGASFNLPFERLDLERCALVLKRGQRELRLPIDGAIVRRDRGAADLTISSVIDRANLHVSGVIDGSAGSAHLVASASDVAPERIMPLLPAGVAQQIDDAAGKVTFALDYRFAGGRSAAALQVSLADLSIDARRAGVTARGISGAITFDHLLVPSTPPQQTLHAAHLEAAEQVLSNAVVSLHLVGPRELRIEQLQLHWAGGLVRIDQPFSVDPVEPKMATTVSLDRVGLREVVALITQGRATGSGTASGSMPFAIDLTGDQPRVDLGEGMLRADAPGTLRLGEASDDFGDLMAQSDPTFESDPLKRELRESVVEAMRDFEYHRLEVSFHRTPDGDVLGAMKIHGRGRGGNRLPLHLGVQVDRLERWFQHYLQTRSRVLSGGR